MLQRSHCHSLSYAASSSSLSLDSVSNSTPTEMKSNLAISKSHETWKIVRNSGVFKITELAPTCSDGQTKGNRLDFKIAGTSNYLDSK